VSDFLFEWRRSSTDGMPTYVEVMKDSNGVSIRSSEDPHVVAFFWHDEWREFANAVKRGDFDG